MTEQRKLKTYAPSTLWADGTSARPLPDHVVAQGDVERAADEKKPPPVTARFWCAAASASVFTALPVMGLPATATASLSRTDFQRRPPITSIVCSPHRHSIFTA